MTSLAAKLSVDSRGASGLYILSDSRITLTSSRTNYWDAGQKAFCSHISPDIFAYCGDAFFPPYALRQMIDIGDSGLLFSKADAAECRHDRLFSVFRSTIESVSDSLINDFSVLHGARDSELMSSRFRLWLVRYDSKTTTWHHEEISLNASHSYFCYIGGSGRDTIRQHASKWHGTPAENTSRAAFWSFCDALFTEDDKHSGGPPQLVGLWRKGVARQFGVIWCGKRYLAGAQAPDDSRFSNIYWFNQRFERMDGEKIKLLPGAQRQAKPNRM